MVIYSNFNELFLVNKSVGLILDFLGYSLSILILFGFLYFVKQKKSILSKRYVLFYLIYTFVFMIISLNRNLNGLDWNNLQDFLLTILDSLFKTIFYVLLWKISLKYKLLRSLIVIGIIAIFIDLLMLIPFTGYDSFNGLIRFILAGFGIVFLILQILFVPIVHFLEYLFFRNLLKISEKKEDIK